MAGVMMEEEGEYQPTAGDLTGFFLVTLLFAIVIMISLALWPFIDETSEYFLREYRCWLNPSMYRYC